MISFFMVINIYIFVYCIEKLKKKLCLNSFIIRTNEKTEDDVQRRRQRGQQRG